MRSDEVFGDHGAAIETDVVERFVAQAVVRRFGQFRGIHDLHPRHSALLHDPVGLVESAGQHGTMVAIAHGSIRSKPAAQKALAIGWRCALGRQGFQVHI